MRNPEYQGSRAGPSGSSGSKSQSESETCLPPTPSAPRRPESVNVNIQETQESQFAENADTSGTSWTGLAKNPSFSKGTRTSPRKQKAGQSAHSQTFKKRPKTIKTSQEIRETLDVVSSGPLSSSSQSQESQTVVTESTTASQIAHSHAAATVVPDSDDNESQSLFDLLSGKSIKKPEKILSVSSSTRRPPPPLPPSLALVQDFEDNERRNILHGISSQESVTGLDPNLMSDIIIGAEVIISQSDNIQAEETVTTTETYANIEITAMGGPTRIQSQEEDSRSLNLVLSQSQEKAKLEKGKELEKQKESQEKSKGSGTSERTLSTERSENENTRKHSQSKASKKKMSKKLIKRRSATLASMSMRTGVSSSDESISSDESLKPPRARRLYR